MYQKPKPREPQAERPHQPWFKKNGFDNKFENKRGAGRGDFKPRGNFGDKPRGNFAGAKPRNKFPGAGKPGGFSKPSGGNFKRPNRAEG